MWQGTLCSHWSTTVSEQGSAGTGLCINALPSFCSKAYLPTSQRSGMEWQKERDWQSVLHTELCASLCSPWSLLHPQLPAMCGIGDNSVHISYSADFLCLLHEPVEIWSSRQRSGLVCSVPHLVTKIPFTQLPSTESACLLTTTLRSGQDKLSERKTDCAGRDGKVNMVPASSYTLPSIPLPLRGITSSCSPWAEAVLRVSHSE